MDGGPEAFCQSGGGKTVVGRPDLEVLCWIRVGRGLPQLKSGFGDSLPHLEA